MYACYVCLNGCSVCSVCMYFMVCMYVCCAMLFITGYVRFLVYDCMRVCMCVNCLGV